MVYDYKGTILKDEEKLRAHITGRNEGIRDALQFIDNWVKQYNELPRGEVIRSYLKASIIEVEKHD